MASKGAETVKVVVRCRPLNSTEKTDGRARIVEMDAKMGTVSLAAHAVGMSSTEPPKTFTFDAVFPPETQQLDLYNATAAPILDSVLQGYNGTIFAYGQTGTGKTFTMEGANEPPELRGVIPRAFNQIFEQIALHEGQSTEFLVRASYLEIYNEEIRDLLSKQTQNKLDLKEDPQSGVYVKDLTSYVVKTTKECDKLRDFGANNRHVGATKMNQESSRSHSIYSITIESCETRPDGTASIRMGKLNLVDLAGSERQSKTQASGERLKEATKINLSLSALGNCISALVDGRSTHIPYRDSKLTRLLQDSLGGNTKTVMVANLGPADWNYDETLSTLRYANRAKNIKNKPKINEDPKDAMLREFQEEIKRLKEKLEGRGPTARRSLNSTASGEGGVSEQRVDVPVEKIVEVEKEVEVERLVEIEKLVEVEKLVEIEKIIERPIEVERIVEVLREVPVEKIVEVEKLVGMREDEVERMKNELRLKAEREKQQLIDLNLLQQEEILSHKRMLEEQRQRQQVEAEERATVAMELKELEEKIMHGGEHVKDRVARQQLEIEQRERELEQQRAKEVHLEQERLAREEERLAQEEKHSTLAEEAESKGRKLKQLWAKFRAAQAEVQDLQVEHQQEKEDLLQTVRELTRQLQLQKLVIESFIPPADVAKLEARAVWDDSGAEEWRLLPLKQMQEADSDQRPFSQPWMKRPTSAFALKMAGESGAANTPRFHVENILSLDLDMPERTTADYEIADEINPNVRAALSAALQDEEGLELEAAENLPSMSGWTPDQVTAKPAGGRAAPDAKPRRSKPKARKPKDPASGLDEALLFGLDGRDTPPEEAFPESRGLVRR